MLHIQRTIQANYGVQQVYRLINDIPAYPAFVPGCIAAQALSQQEHPITALLQINQAGI